MLNAPFATVTVAPVPCFMITEYGPELPLSVVALTTKYNLSWSLGLIVTVLFAPNAPVNNRTLYIPSVKVPSVVVKV